MSGFKSGRRAHKRAGRFLLAAALVTASGGCGLAKRKPALHVVEIKSFEFVPAALAVALGDTIEWVNRDILPHTATARSGKWDSQTLLPQASWRLVAAARGGEPYACLFHPTMEGTIEVR